MLDEESDQYKVHFHTNVKVNYYDENNRKQGECDKLFYIPETTSNEKKDIYDKWVASICISFFISAFDLGLAIFGLLLFIDSKALKDSIPITNGTVSIKFK